MSPATKFVNRKAHHTKKDKSAGSFGQGRIALGLGRGKFMTTREPLLLGSPQATKEGA